MQQFSAQSYLRSQNLEYIEEMLERYLVDPLSVDESWQYFFDGLALGGETPSAPIAATSTSAPATQAAASTSATEQILREIKVLKLIEAYRTLGHLTARTNPLVSSSNGATPAAAVDPRLTLAYYGLTNHDLKSSFQALREIRSPKLNQNSTLEAALQVLQETYGNTTSVEVGHIQDEAVRDWVLTAVEGGSTSQPLNAEQQKRILTKLTEAECFERYLHTRFVAQKRFSIEGGDALVPMLVELVHAGAKSGLQDLVLGMAHRGRLNVLTNVFQKPYQSMLVEFEGTYKLDTSMGESDVKYHMGYSADMATAHGNVHLSLGFNPSHLEFINPVALGVARAKLRKHALVAQADANKAVLDYSKVFSKVVSVQVHGDAAFAGQGVVYETLQMSGLKAYQVGGSIHVIVNNQVGFTTSPRDSRTTRYSSDLARILEAPIIRVNGDDAEACVRAMLFAVEFRNKFNRDILIDLLCYRKYGHNEGDEPSFTQPVMYRQIKDHKSPREIYATHLTAQKVLAAGDTQKLVDDVNAQLTTAHQAAKAAKDVSLAVSAFEGAWKGLRRATDVDFESSVPTAVSVEALKEYGAKLTHIPSTLKPHPKLQRLIETRRAQIEQGQGLEWGTAEGLAFASLVAEGVAVRITGQDVERGTFSHRHSVWYDVETNQPYTPLHAIHPAQSQYEGFNSHLSETAVLGYEFGYSVAEPRVLSIWEAQFGDFGNGAQVIIDQFIASSETKWSRMSGLVLLLPHGYEGQGPEHSSARLERYLQLCARNNMQVVNLSTPAQIFHALRRQVKRDFRKPLIVMSPKSVLRHPMAISTLEELSDGRFLEIIDDTLTAPQRKKIKKLILCTGKVYYDLLAAKNEAKAEHVALVRVEQLYPLATKQLIAVLNQYTAVKEICWVQEEPKNMGAWMFMRDPLEAVMAESKLASAKLSYVGRPASASPAVGSIKVHNKEQSSIVEEALK